jgi:hypothetical protein
VELGAAIPWRGEARVAEVGDGGTPLLRCGRRKKKPGGLKGRTGRRGCWADSAGSCKNPFGIKIRFLNLQSLWKFVQGDLGGILM